MGCLRRILVIAILLWNLAAFVFTVIVLGNARTLGNAALIAESDALAIFIACGVGIALTLLLVLLLYLGHRRTRRLERQLRALRDMALTRETIPGPSQPVGWE